MTVRMGRIIDDRALWVAATSIGARRARRLTRISGKKRR